MLDELRTVVGEARQRARSNFLDLRFVDESIALLEDGLERLRVKRRDLKVQLQGAAQEM